MTNAQNSNNGLLINSLLFCFVTIVFNFMM